MKTYNIYPLDIETQGPYIYTGIRATVKSNSLINALKEWHKCVNNPRTRYSADEAKRSFYVSEVII